VKKVAKKVKKVAAPPAQLRKNEPKKDDKAALFEKRPRSFGIGRFQFQFSCIEDIWDSVKWAPACIQSSYIKWAFNCA
jgi:hypothetical protein